MKAKNLVVDPPIVSDPPSTELNNSSHQQAVMGTGSLRIGLQSVRGGRKYTHRIVVLEGQDPIRKLGSYNHKTGEVFNLDEDQTIYWLQQGIEVTIAAATALVDQPVYREFFGDTKLSTPALFKALSEQSSKVNLGTSDIPQIKDLGSEDPDIRRQAAKTLGQYHKSRVS